MSYNEVQQLLMTFGFPTVACVACGFYVKYITDQMLNIFTGILSDIDKTIEENTTTLAELKERMKNHENV